MAMRRTAHCRPRLLLAILEGDVRESIRERKMTVVNIHARPEQAQRAVTPPSAWFFGRPGPASDKPARLTHLDYRDERCILIKGRMASAQIVCLGHGTLRRLLPSDEYLCPRRAP